MEAAAQSGGVGGYAACALTGGPDRVEIRGYALSSDPARQHQSHPEPVGARWCYCRVQHQFRQQADPEQTVIRIFPKEGDDLARVEREVRKALAGLGISLDVQIDPLSDLPGIEDET